LSGRRDRGGVIQSRFASMAGVALAALAAVSALANASAPASTPLKVKVLTDLGFFHVEGWRGATRAEVLRCNTVRVSTFDRRWAVIFMTNPVPAICHRVMYNGVFLVHQFGDGRWRERTEGSADIPCQRPGMPSAAVLRDLHIPCQAGQA
jgi:hypothetical protein